MNLDKYYLCPLSPIKTYLLTALTMPFVRLASLCDSPERDRNLSLAQADQRAIHGIKSLARNLWASPGIIDLCLSCRTQLLIAVTLHTLWVALFLQSIDIMIMESSNNTRSGVWSDEEHKSFEQACILYGWGSWELASTFIPTRSTTQVKSHGQKFAISNPKRMTLLINQHAKSNVFKSQHKKGIPMKIIGPK